MSGPDCAARWFETLLKYTVSSYVYAKTNVTAKTLYTISQLFIETNWCSFVEEWKREPLLIAIWNAQKISEYDPKQTFLS